MLRSRSIAVSCLILWLAGCGTAERPSTPTSVSQRSSVSRVQPSLSATTFVAENSSIELFVTRSSELALQRSSSPRVREFAQRMVDDHKGTSGQLSLEGRRLNLLPSATLAAGEQALLDALQASSQFDADYVRDQRAVHRRLLSIDSAYAANGSSPTLRPVASAALPIEQRHLRLIAYL